MLFENINNMILCCTLLDTIKKIYIIKSIKILTLVLNYSIRFILHGQENTRMLRYEWTS